MNTNPSIAIASLMLISSTLWAQVAFKHSPSHAPTPIDGNGVWTHFAGNAKRNAVPSVAMMPSLDAPAWVNTDHVPVAQTGLVVDDRHVYAMTVEAGNTYFAVALDRDTGEEIWSTPIAPVILDSWSSPVIDIEHGTLIIATGSTIVALDATTGNQVWAHTLSSTIVNASPVVTDDLGHRDRVLITNYSFGGLGNAQLICINIDPFNADTNPYHPGDLVWAKNLGADSSGNTPAYQNGRVYLATASNGSGSRGTIRSYDITADIAPTTPTWSFTNTINAGFFGGVSIATGHIYASSYSFTGLQTGANTVKLNKHTGALVWSVPTNRTDATPIVLPNGDVIVSAGVAQGEFDFIPFFGTIPSISYIVDAGSSAALAWDSFLETHDDTNNNGFWDFGESYLSIGGWTHQPIAITVNNIPHLLVGTLPLNSPISYIGNNTDLRLLDLTKSPTDAGFIVDHATDTGNTPAIASGWIYSGSDDGIKAFAPPSALLTVRSLVDRYTRGEITLHELLERLPR
jgi:outer membrane protein assembly factor BamB